MASGLHPREPRQEPTSAVAGACSSCGEHMPRRARFCPACGSAAIQPPTDERRPVTILFVDLVGSTALAEQLDPEDWKSIVNPALARFGAVIERNGGHVAQLLGDGLLAFFGAPIAHEDDAMRAVRAGLDVIASLAPDLPAGAGPADHGVRRLGGPEGVRLQARVGTSRTSVGSRRSGGGRAPASRGGTRASAKGRLPVSGTPAAPVLVVGAGGRVGGRVGACCATEAWRFARSCRPRPGSVPWRLRVERTAGDLRDPASLAGAADAVSAIVMTATRAGGVPGDTPDFVDDGGVRALVTPPRWRVCGASWSSPPPSPTATVAHELLRAKAAAEAHLAASDLDWTAVAPEMFTEVGYPRSS